MADAKRSSQRAEKRKKKFRSDGTPIWAKRYIDGPGIWLGVKGKEKQTVSELYDVFNSVASDLWPINQESTASDSDSDHERDGLSIEARIANEVSAMKRPKTESRFVNCQTNTPCVIFISCRPPVNPVELVMKHVKNVEATGVTRTRYTHRLVPVSGTCVTNLPEIQTLCHVVFEAFFSREPQRKFSYKIELRVRNHTTITRPALIQHIAECVPDGHTVALKDPEIFILVEVFKSVCGVSVVEDYYRLQKFNVMEIANVKGGGGRFEEEGRVPRNKEARDIRHLIPENPST